MHARLFIACWLLAGQHSAWSNSRGPDVAVELSCLSQAAVQRQLTPHTSILISVSLVFPSILASTLLLPGLKAVSRKHKLEQRLVAIACTQEASSAFCSSGCARLLAHRRLEMASALSVRAAGGQVAPNLSFFLSPGATCSLLTSLNSVSRLTSISSGSLLEMAAMTACSVYSTPYYSHLRCL